MHFDIQLLTYTHDLHIGRSYKQHIDNKKNENSFTFAGNYLHSLCRTWW